MLIDSHCHLDDYDDLPAVLERAREAGVGRMLAIGIGDGPATMHRALELAHGYPQIWASAGIHPQEAHQATPEWLEKLATLVDDPRCIAVGDGARVVDQGRQLFQPFRRRLVSLLRMNPRRCPDLRMSMRQLERPVHSRRPVADADGQQRLHAGRRCALQHGCAVSVVAVAVEMDVGID